MWRSLDAPSGQPTACYDGPCTGASAGAWGPASPDSLVNYVGYLAALPDYLVHDGFDAADDCRAEFSYSMRGCSPQHDGSAITETITLSVGTGTRNTRWLRPDGVMCEYLGEFRASP